MNTCQAGDCRRERVRDALYCRDHLREAWGRREPEWMKRKREVGLPAKELVW